MKEIFHKLFRLNSRKKARSIKLKDDMFYFEFNNALKQDDCPICSLLRMFERKFIESIFYESINDGEFRRQINHSQGLCVDHTRIFCEYGDALGLSILGANLLEIWLCTLSAEPKSRCLLCENSEETEKYLLDTFTQFLSSEEFWLTLNASPGLCRRHFQKILPQLKNKHLQSRFSKWQKEKIESLLDNLYEFIRKNDYRFNEESVSVKEINALRLAWRFLQK
ncbi:MAG: hypothetical protein GXO77_09635 [Calditrichaeota bacterium]|nr:hypothetical protein [Calditrichota bacterium]